MPWTLLLDFVVAALLVVTIAYAVLLNRRLGNLRRDRAELEKMAQSFHHATVRAEQSVSKLKVTADALQTQIDKAQGLSDDLSFLIDRGSSAADRLEDKVRAVRDQGPPPEPAQTVPSAPPPVAANGAARAPTLRPVAAVAPDAPVEPKSEAERELLRALRAAR